MKQLLRRCALHGLLLHTKRKFAFHIVYYYVDTSQDSVSFSTNAFAGMHIAPDGIPKVCDTNAFTGYISSYMSTYTLRHRYAM